MRARRMTRVPSDWRLYLAVALGWVVGVSWPVIVGLL